MQDPCAHHTVPKELTCLRNELNERRLADAGLAGNKDELPLSVASPLQRRSQHVELRGATYDTGGRPVEYRSFGDRDVRRGVDLIVYVDQKAIATSHNRLDDPRAQHLAKLANV